MTTGSIRIAMTSDVGLRRKNNQTPDSPNRACS